jgi:predicted lipoprotein with Yx(FWY)xxD motif
MNYFTLATRNRPPGPNRHMLLRCSGLVATLSAIAVVAAACGSAASTSTTTTAAPAGTAASAKSIELASSTLPGVGSVLTGPNGRTLYYFTTDSPTSTSCTGQCAVVWPPLLVSKGAQAALGSGVSGTLGTVMRPDGSTQVTYRGHLLYYYEGDTAPGQDKGQGLDGTWFVMTTSGTTPATSPTTTTTAGGGGGGVGF